MEWKPVLREVAQAYYNASTWIRETRAGRKEGPEMAKMFCGELKTKVDRAIAAKVPESFVIAGSGETKPATLAEIKTLIAPYLTEANKAVDQQSAAEEAKWQPYTSLLEGDRLKYFNDNYRKGVNVYGPGGRYLEKPADFQKATVMHTYTVNKEGLVPRWEVTGRRFKGNKLVGAPIIRNGVGDRPPASAYK